MTALPSWPELADVAVKLDEDEWVTFWSALGTVVRLACGDPAKAPAAKTEINNTAAGTERRWAPIAQAPATAFGFGASDVTIGTSADGSVTVGAATPAASRTR